MATRSYKKQKIRRENLIREDERRKCNKRLVSTLNNKYNNTKFIGEYIIMVREKYYQNRLSKGYKTKDAIRVGLASIVFSLSGCGISTTQPIPAGKNTYVLSSKEGVFPTGDQPLMETALATANRHCSSQNKTIKLLNTNENPGPYIVGNYPKVTII